MGMSKSRGSLPPPEPHNPKRCFDVPGINPKEIDFAEVPVELKPQDQLNAEAYVARSASDLGTISEDDKQNASVLAYIEGSTITCTFYTQLTSDSYGRSTYNTYSETIDQVHQHYRKIINFQMKLKDSVQYNYNNEATQSSVEGEAILYPFFCPYKGDMFIYQTNTNKLGLFKITEAPTRLAISNSTCHEIKFILVTWVTDAILKQLDSYVDDIVYFNLDSFLASGGAFLTSDEHAMMGDVEKAIAVLTHRYVADYFERKVYHTFIENACLYDPYVVEFCLTLFDLEDLPEYPVQLKPDPPCWKESFWHMLLDPDYTPEELVIWRAVKLNNAINYRTTTINALANRCFIQLDKRVHGTHAYPPFVLPKKFDEADVTVPMQVRLYLNERKIYPNALLALANEMLTVRRIAGFYFIPIVIFLLKLLYKALKDNNANIIYHPTDEDKEDDKGCCGDCSDCIFACNPPHLKYMPRCPGHRYHQCSFDGDCNVMYVPPCGGCRTDAEPYPYLYNPDTPISCLPPPPRPDKPVPPKGKGIKFDTLEQYPPKKIPAFGPGPTPIPCPHPPIPRPPQYVEWEEILNKPDTYPPDPHKHTPDDLIGNFSGINSIQIIRPPCEAKLFLVLEFFNDKAMTDRFYTIDGRTEEGAKTMSIDNGEGVFVDVTEEGLGSEFDNRILSVNTGAVEFNGMVYVRWTWYGSDSEVVATSVFTYPSATPGDPGAMGIFWQDN